MGLFSMALGTGSGGWSRGGYLGRPRLPDSAAVVSLAPLPRRFVTQLAPPPAEQDPPGPNVNEYERRGLTPCPPVPPVACVIRRPSDGSLGAR